MDIEKAEQAANLLERHNFIKFVLGEANTMLSASNHGTATITIPRAWLPDIIEMAKGELDLLEGEIAKL